MIKRRFFILFFLCVLIVSTLVCAAEDIPLRSMEDLPFTVTARAGATDPAAGEVRQRVLLSIRINKEQIAQVSCIGANTKVEKAQGKNAQVFDFFTHIPADMPFELLTFIAVDEKGNYVASQQILILIEKGKAQFKWLYMAG